MGSITFSSTLIPERWLQVPQSWHHASKMVNNWVGWEQIYILGTKNVENEKPSLSKVPSRLRILGSPWVGLFQDLTGIAQSGKPGQSENRYPLTAPFSFPSAGSVWFYHFSSSPGALGVGGLHTPRKFSFFPSRCDPSTHWMLLCCGNMMSYHDSYCCVVPPCTGGQSHPDFWVSCLLKAHSWVPPVNFPPQQVAVVFKFTFPPSGAACIQWHSVADTMAHLPCLNSGHLWRVIAASELPVDWLSLSLHYSSTPISAQPWFSQPHTGALEDTSQ